MADTLLHCSRCFSSVDIPLLSCGNCADDTALCYKCRLHCACGMQACLECFLESHVHTCFNARHFSTSWNPVFLWTCSCHESVRQTTTHQQMTCDKCHKSQLCADGASDCDCGDTLCAACLLAHECPAEQPFESDFLTYKCIFREHNGSCAWLCSLCQPPLAPSQWAPFCV